MNGDINNKNAQNDSDNATYKFVEPPPPPPLPRFKSQQREVPLPPQPPPPPAPPLPSTRGKSLDDLGLLFRPFSIFFYGSLMDSEVLQAVLALPTVPSMEKGSIKGFKIKMWGIYPTLVRMEGGEVEGTVWEVSNVGDFLRLAEYETHAYTTCPCEIIKSNGEVISDGKTFCWAGDANSKELEDGCFDFARYQKYFKPSVVRSST